MSSAKPEEATIRRRLSAELEWRGGLGYTVCAFSTGRDTGFGASELVGVLQAWSNPIPAAAVQVFRKRRREIGLIMMQVSVKRIKRKSNGETETSSACMPFYRIPSFQYGGCMKECCRRSRLPDAQNRRIL